MTRVGVKNFGPINEGSATLKPFTVLIGPNNAGKSYFALFLYALLSPFSRLTAAIRTHLPLRTQIWLNLLELDGGLGQGGANGPSVSFEQLEDEVKRMALRGSDAFPGYLATALGKELQRCFGIELSGLTRSGSTGNATFHLEYQPNLSIDLTIRDKELSVSSARPDITNSSFDPSFGESLRAAFGEQELATLVGTQVYPRLFRSSYYFPAARSGILQAHRALASFMLSRSPLIGIEDPQIPRLSGAVADFIGNLLQLEKRAEKQGVSSVARFLEGKVSGGTIDLETSGHLEYPEIYYESGGARYPLYLASSMVSELAPVVLFLKYIVRSGDFLIIEEPEAHLHPDSQRSFAQAMVKLVRQGVQVLITTHSDYFVQQISNFILMSGVGREATNLPYSSDDYLKAEEVGAYLFRFDDSAEGSVIEELNVTEDDGVPEDEFVRIAREIYDETVTLEHLRSRS